MPTGDFLTVDEARARILASVAPLPSTLSALEEVLGLVLAVPVAAPIDLPPFRNSAMDGYAVRATETRSATVETPVPLRVIGSVAAGDRAGPSLAGGEAIRIMTGAPVPDGADAIVRFEDTDELARSKVDPGHSEISVLRPVAVAENVRQAGEEVRSGETVLAAGKTLGPAQMGLLASLGIDRVQVVPRPRVGILSTGDELTPPGQLLRAGQVFDANGGLLNALVVESGAIAVSLGVAADQTRSIGAHLSAVGDLDLIVTSGGVSAGDYDLVKDALSAQGEVAIWQIRMKPGKPLGFGTISGVPIIGLPGNPVAAAVSFEIFVRPLLAKLSGRPDPMLPAIHARLTASIANHGGRRQYARSIVARDRDGSLVASIAPDQSSSKLSILSQANALIVIPETVAVAEAGMSLPVIILERDPEKLRHLL